MTGWGLTESCPVGQRWLLLDLVSAIKFIGILFNWRVALLNFFHGIHLMSTRLFIVRTHC